MSKPTEFWNWVIVSDTYPFKPSKTRHKMTVAEALERHPEAVRVPSSMEIRNLPETDEERLSLHTNSYQRNRPK